MLCLIVINKINIKHIKISKHQKSESKQNENENENENEN